MGPGTSSKRQPPQPSVKTPDRFPPTDTSSLDEQIRARAHQIWLAHDGNSGSAEADWLQAEEEILNETKK